MISPPVQVDRQGVRFALASARLELTFPFDPTFVKVLVAIAEYVLPHEDIVFLSEFDDFNFGSKSPEEALHVERQWLPSLWDRSLSL
jgi:hypothetical protein